MKLSIRWKLMLFIAGISLAVTVLLAWSVYTYSYNKLYSNFLNNKLSLIRTIARSIDGEIHKKLLSNDDTQTQEYKRLQKYLHNLKSSDKAITYLYTLNYNKDEDQFTYCLDGDKAENNIFWIESDQFAIEIHFDSVGQSYIQNKQKRFSNHVIIKHNQLNFKLTLLDTDTAVEILANNTLIARADKSEPFNVQIGDVGLNAENRDLETILELDGNVIDVYLSLSLKGEPLSIPGDLFKESPEVLNEYKTVLHSRKDNIRKTFEEGIYGKLLSVNSVIFDSLENPIGLACLEVYEKELVEFRKEFSKIAILISILSVLFVLITLPLLLEYFVVRKVKLINLGINKIADNELETKISIHSNDEFENVANGFNTMTQKLKSFYDDLDQMVKQRTLEVEQQKEELSTQSECIKEANTLLIEKNTEIEIQKKKIENQNKHLQEVVDKLAESEESLKHLLETKDKLFSIIAHDLRSPFTALVGLTEVLAKQAGELNPEDVSNYGSLVHESASRLLVLIENLLSWSRSQTGNLKLVPQRLNLYELTADVSSVLAVQAQSKNIQIQNNIPNWVVVLADHDTIATVLRNLLSNAIKFTNIGGVVKISIDVHENHIHTKISDTGVGLTPKQKEQLFKFADSFSTKGTNDESGTGLGLIICKEFVQKNGGNIWVDSVENEGTTFTFSLPVNQATN
jgi:signal transduction histidine kinase